MLAIVGASGCGHDSRPEALKIRDAYSEYVDAVKSADGAAMCDLMTARASAGIVLAASMQGDSAKACPAAARAVALKTDDQIGDGLSRIDVQMGYATARHRGEEVRFALVRGRWLIDTKPVEPIPEIPRIEDEPPIASTPEFDDAPAASQQDAPASGACDAPIVEVSPATTCSFAHQVFADYQGHVGDEGWEITVASYSEALGRSVDMWCAPREPRRSMVWCEGGDGARVVFPTIEVQP